MAKQSIKVSYNIKGFKKPTIPKLAFLKRVTNGKRKA